MPISRSTLPAILIAAVMLLAGGWILALAIDPAAILGMPRPAVKEEAAHEDHDDAHEGHVHLNKAAYENLNLQMKKAAVTSGKRTIQIPGEIVEMPGQSDHALAAPVNGVVTESYVLPGQAIRSGDPLFKLQVIDEALATAQLNLLGTIAKLATNESELKRIGPLADAGTVLGRKKLELEYELNELSLKQRLYEQELAVRGLTDDQINKIKRDKELIRELIVRMPEDSHAHAPMEPHPGDDGPGSESPPDSTRPLRPVSSSSSEHDWEHTVEELKVFPGKSVERGDDLCHVAYHTKLYIQGEVFEKEQKYVAELGIGPKKDWTVTALFGARDEFVEKTGLRPLPVDNHVDPDSQTYKFYVPLNNKPVRDTVDEDGRHFRSWLYKPGQRVHLRIPTQPYTNQIVLPLAAVAIDGPHIYVFRETEVELSEEEKAHGHSHSGEIFIDLERVPVVAEYQDSNFVYISPDGELRPGDLIATNNAYRLFLEQKAQAGGDAAGHGHEH